MTELRIIDFKDVVSGDLASTYEDYTNLVAPNIMHEIDDHDLANKRFSVKSRLGRIVWFNDDHTFTYYRKIIDAEYIEPEIEL